MIQQIYPQVNHSFKYELNKDMQFAAAHFIPDERAGACAKTHGHTYFINLTIVGNELDDLGFLVNFHTLKKLVHGRFDHTLLNSHASIFTGENGDPDYYPTTEVLAETIFLLVETYLHSLPNRPYCKQVFVRETPTSYVLYRPQS